MALREYNFDGLVGPTHNYGGLSPGNVASQRHGGQVCEPARGGAAGAREDALRRRARRRPGRAAAAAAAVAADAARAGLRAARTRRSSRGRRARTSTCCGCARAPRRCGRRTPPPCAPSSDTADGRLHLTPANLQQMFHRAHRGGDDARGARAPSSRTSARFAVHAPLPGGGQFADEGAANHTRLAVDGPAGGAPLRLGPDRAAGDAGPERFPARQTLEASRRRSRGCTSSQPERVPLPAAAPGRASTPARSTPTCWPWATAAS